MTMKLYVGETHYEDFRILNAEGENISDKMLIESVDIKISAGEGNNSLTTASIVCYLDKTSVNVFDKDVHVYYDGKRLTPEQKEQISVILNNPKTK